MASPASVPADAMIGPGYLPIFWVPASVLLAVIIVVTPVRFCTARRSSRGWGWDDTVTAFALVLVISYVSILIALYARGRGRQLALRDPAIDVPLSVADGLLWMWALNATRISVALFLLPLREHWRWWRWTLWSVIAVNIGWLPAATVVQLIICRPLSALWSPTPDAVCLTPDQLLPYARAYNSFNMVTNLILCLLPLTFIPSIHRPRAEKVAIACLMTAGLAATAIEIVRLAWFLDAGIHQRLYPPLLDVVWDLLCGFELLIGFAAASLPKAKEPAFRLLRRLHLLSVPGDNAAAGAKPDSLPRRLPHGSWFSRQLEMLEHGRAKEDHGPVLDSEAKTGTAVIAVARPPPCWEASQTDTVYSDDGGQLETGNVSSDRILALPTKAGTLQGGRRP